MSDVETEAVQNWLM